MKTMSFSYYLEPIFHDDYYHATWSIGLPQYNGEAYPFSGNAIREHRIIKAYQ